MGHVSDAVVRINFLYEEGDAGPYDPIVRNVHVEDLTSAKSEYALFLRGYEDDPIRDVTLTSCRFSDVEKEIIVEYGLEPEDVLINRISVG